MKLMKAAEHTSRHPIRSILLAAIAAALATIVLVLASSGKPALAASSLVNGNFETGGLTGWNIASSGYMWSQPSAVAGYDYCFPAPGDGCWYMETISPKEGSYFALIPSGNHQSEVNTISQPFEASNGDKISGWAFFKDLGYNLYNSSTGANDIKGQVVITSDSGTKLGTPFEQSISSVGVGGYSGWKYWEYTFSDLTGTSQFRIEARVQNLGPSDCGGCSLMGLDDVKTSIADPDTTKPSTTATRSIEPNAEGWNKDNVTVKLKATDNEGGWGVEKITYSASGAQSIAKTDASGSSVDVKLDQEGTTNLTYYATDKAGNVEDQNTLQVKIDKTAPTVKKTSPAINETRVSASAKISATFLEGGSGIDSSTLTARTFVVSQMTRSGYVPVSGTISYDAGSKTVTFTPDSNLAKATYMAEIGGVEDKADNVLYPELYTSKFSTATKL